ASQLIIAHNHPHTDAKPSTADNLLTYELKKACDLIDLSLIDHVIVGRNETLSYAENGLAPFN
ncbi:JAB domain-containing protein, partial [Psychrobacter sp. 16-Bac2893]